MKAENDVDLVDAILAELAPVMRAHLRERLPALLRAARPKARRVYAPVSAEDRAAAEQVDELTRARARNLLKGRRR